VSSENLTFMVLVGLPVVAAAFLGLLMRALVIGGRWWPLWLFGLVGSSVLWGLVFWGIALSEAA
jgi:hypothetical protein